MPPAFAWMLVFQSTFPLQGTTVYVGRYAYRYAFQSTFPLQGTTISLPCDLICPGHFNPRSHCRERLLERAAVDVPFAISIHVPIAGNDKERLEPMADLAIFQSTFPLQGTTFARVYADLITKEFQSTFPLQGTTSNFRPSLLWFKFQSTFPLQGTTANLSNF